MRISVLVFPACTSETCLVQKVEELRCLGGEQYEGVVWLHEYIASLGLDRASAGFGAAIIVAIGD